MKKILFMLTLLATIIFTSCEDKEEGLSMKDFVNSTWVHENESGEKFTIIVGKATETIAELVKFEHPRFKNDNIHLIYFHFYNYEQSGFYILANDKYYDLVLVMDFTGKDKNHMSINDVIYIRQK